MDPGIHRPPARRRILGERMGPPKLPGNARVWTSAGRGEGRLLETPLKMLRMRSLLQPREDPPVPALELGLAVQRAS